jgi:hypothetical protein
LKSIETRRSMSAARLGKSPSESTKQKLRGRDTRPFPPHCIKCSSRDAAICARFNKTCFHARETDCFKRSMKRIEHKDYQK